MSTRSCIARPWGDGFEGRYCHSDGYPTGVGQHLHRSYHEAFKGDLDAMIKYLIDDEPTGWSSICGFDLSNPPGWVDIFKEGKGEPVDAFVEDPDERFPMVDWAKLHAERGPQSFSHRGEDPLELIRYDGSDDWDTWGTEWIYVLSPGGLFVWSSGSKPEPIVLVPWHDHPDWERVECGENFERCIHVDGYHERAA